jgi:multisubunit Na+/H+ antiporter MnhE subunit
MPDLSGRGAGDRRQCPAPTARRIGAWVTWWVLLMSFWVILDDSIALDELLAGAGAAAIGATLAELAGHQADSRLRLRVEWLGPALRLPAQVACDTGIIFAALWRQLARGQAPPSGLRELPVRVGGDSDEDVTRRVLLVGGRSVAPNTFALGIDRERGTMLVHELVMRPGEPGEAIE